MVILGAAYSLVTALLKSSYDQAYRTLVSRVVARAVTRRRDSACNEGGECDVLRRGVIEQIPVTTAGLAVGSPTTATV